MSIPFAGQNGMSEKCFSGTLRCVTSNHVLWFRWLFVQLLLISVVGCNVHRQSESPAKPETRSERPLTGDEARQALIRMIERDHQDDRLLRGALPYLRTIQVKQVDNDTVEIGTWTCYLKERRFTGGYVSVEQKSFANFTGNFVHDNQGQWKGVITEQTRND